MAVRTFPIGTLHAEDAVYALGWLPFVDDDCVDGWATSGHVARFAEATLGQAGCALAWAHKYGWAESYTDDAYGTQFWGLTDFGAQIADELGNPY